MDQESRRSTGCISVSLILKRAYRYSAFPVFAFLIRDRKQWVRPLLPSRPFWSPEKRFCKDKAFSARIMVIRKKGGYEKRFPGFFRSCSIFCIAFLLLTTNTSDCVETEVVITDSQGNVTIWYPFIDESNRIGPLCNDEGTSLYYDFSPYD